MRGELVLRIGKDRPGEIRPHCGGYQGKDRIQEAAKMIIDSTDETGGVKVTVQAPEGTPAGEPTTWGMVRRTATMEAVSITMEDFPDGLTQNQTQDYTKCRREYVPEALKILKAAKYITSVRHPARSNYPLWVSVKPYRQQTDPLLTTGGNGPGEERSE